MGERIRVLVVEDSLTIRMRLCEIIESDPELELAGHTGDGTAALELVRSLSPDVISLDLVLPGKNGLEITEEVMAHFPAPILIVSSSMNRGEVFQTCDALAAGAVDVLDKPGADVPVSEWTGKYVRMLKMVSRIRVMTHLRGRLRRAPRAALIPMTPPEKKETGRDSLQISPPALATAASVVAIGASAGGPAALLDVFTQLPAPFPLPVLVVLHVSAPFSWAIADWLSENTGHSVRLARDGEPLSSLGGKILLAPANQHLLCAPGGILRLSDGPERHSCRPSVDVLFESLATGCGNSTLACLLTGMGRDGAQGLLRIKEAGGITFAQDEASSVIWGMPGEAVALGAAQLVLPLSDFGKAILSAAGIRQGGNRA